jgi:hypothetical protein
LPASYCYAYEPKVKAGEKLADKYKKHHWFLPSTGITMRILYYASINELLDDNFSLPELTRYVELYTSSMRNEAYSTALAFNPGTGIVSWAHTKHGQRYSFIVVAF